jgi:hypothetical protein
MFFLVRKKFTSTIKYIDVPKVEQVIGKTIGKKISLNKKADITDVIDGEKVAMTTNREKFTEHGQVSLKKQIVPDEHVEKMEEKQTIKKEKLNNITNIFLKLKMIEDAYLERLKNKKINLNRVSKYGDFVYYSMKTYFGDKSYSRYAAVNKNSTNHFFLKLKKGDFISDKLVGKKVGQVVNYNYNDLMASLPEEDRKFAMESVENAVNKVSKHYKRGDANIKLPETKDLLYSVAILDFIPAAMIKDLSLEAELYQKLHKGEQKADDVKNVKPENPAKNKSKNSKNAESNRVKDIEVKGPGANNSQTGGTKKGKKQRLDKKNMP